MTQLIDKSISTVEQLLRVENIAIPAYQRPYKWTLKNISQLFQDIQAHSEKKAYRLGSIVLHQRNEMDIQTLDIVDGQQRTLTLVIIVWAIIQARCDKLVRQDIKSALSELKPLVESFLEKQKFTSDISKRNLHQNYLEASRIVSRSDFTEEHIYFLLHHCQAVIFILEDVSEAFQFFDSQNARGRDLEPHDLLKAFHLREFPEYENKLKAISVTHWENLDSDELATLFSTYLYRIRQWAEGKSARYFGKGQVGLFKGVNIDKIGCYPYVEPLRITHHYVDDYNNQYHRKIDGQKMVFPFHLDQMVINGRRFFEMAEHYQRTISEIVDNEQKKTEKNENIVIRGVSLNERSSEIIHTLNSYKARTRTGDKYVRSIFDCAIIFYIDKFGEQSLSNAIEKIFTWAYSCRIKQQVVQLATADNYVLENNLLRVIKGATLPIDVLSFPIESIKSSENRNNLRSNNSDNDPLVKLFKGMNFYE